MNTAVKEHFHATITTTTPVAAFQRPHSRGAVALAPAPVVKECADDKYQWEDIKIVRNLALTTRLVTTSERHEPTHFEVQLQVFGATGWHTIIIYEFKRGRGHRHALKANGARKTLLLDLPRNVILEMAGEDLQRNWAAYYEDYLKYPSSKWHACPA